jgi:hypothetical protein
MPESIMKLEKTLQKEYAHANELAKDKHKKDEERKHKMRQRDHNAFLQELIDADNQDGLGGECRAWDLTSAAARFYCPLSGRNTYESY